jgi:hypothetical protein
LGEYYAGRNKLNSERKYCITLLTHRIFKKNQTHRKKSSGCWDLWHGLGMVKGYKFSVVK